MLTSTKSGVPEKDRNASVSAAEVIGRVVQHDQTWAMSEPATKAGMASCHRLRHVDRRQHRMQRSSAGLRPNRRRGARLGWAEALGCAPILPPKRTLPLIGSTIRVPRSSVLRA
jgi:hypothetical protein